MLPVVARRPLLASTAERHTASFATGRARLYLLASPGRQRTCSLPLIAPWPASSQIGRPTSCYYMSGRQSLARLCAARLRAWRSGMQLAAMPSSADSLDRAAMHSTASTSSSAPGDSAAEKETIAVTFYDEKDKSEKTVRAVVGQSLMEAAHANEVDLEGACEGSLACSTCHIVLEDANLYNTLPEPTDDENDMLDLAYGLTETSRLGCQVIAAKELDGIRVRIPGATRNFAVDGHVPKPH